MYNLKNKKNILWDFDGVIFDSHEIRDWGFHQMLKDYPRDQVDLLMAYHKENGGLSRYVKFNYFFDTIREEKVSSEKLLGFTEGFSEIMRMNLADKKYLIKDSFNFIQQQHDHYRMHIVSGSDGEELRYICQAVDLEKYFLSIEGSPTPKIKLVEKVIKQNSYIPEETVLIGDSINDFHAAAVNGIEFLGYNNRKLETQGAGYIKSFQ